MSHYFFMFSFFFQDAPYLFTGRAKPQVSLLVHPLTWSQSVVPSASGRLSPPLAELNTRKFSLLREVIDLQKRKK